MTGFVYASMLVYTILAVGILAFLIYVGPSLCAELWDLAVKTEWVERLLLAVEEAREWHTEPGKHRPRPEHGIYRSDDTYFEDLNRVWKEVEDTLRVDLEKKEACNA